jgi:hypothetical protein
MTWRATGPGRARAGTQTVPKPPGLPRHRFPACHMNPPA